LTVYVPNSHRRGLAAHRLTLQLPFPEDGTGLCDREGGDGRYRLDSGRFDPQANNPIPRHLRARRRVLPEDNQRCFIERVLDGALKSVLP